MTDSIFRIAVIPGDGIGREVVPAAQEVLETTGERFGFWCDWTAFGWSCELYARTGSMTGEGAVSDLAGFDAICLGAIGYPGVPARGAACRRHRPHFAQDEQEQLLEVAHLRPQRHEAVVVRRDRRRGQSRHRLSQGELPAVGALEDGLRDAKRADLARALVDAGDARVPGCPARAR